MIHVLSLLGSENAAELADAINVAKEGLGLLEEFTNNLIADINKRFLMDN